MRDAVRSLAVPDRIGQFVSIGLVGAICDATVLVVLSEGLGVLPELATIAGIETAILVMFAANDRWTFGDSGGAGRRPLLRRLARSHLVRAVGSTTQFLVFVAVYRALFVPLALGDVPGATAAVGGLGLPGLSGFDLWLLVAKGIGIGVGMTINYVAESVFTWRVLSDGAGREGHDPDAGSD
jgi:putative flippase GtrA